MRHIGSIGLLGAAAGVVGPLLFFGVATIQGWLRPRYSPLRNYISELGTGPNGWIGRSNSIVVGILRIVFAVGVGELITDGMAARIGIVLLTLAGMCSIGCGLFPAELRPPLSTSGKLHLVFGLLVFGLIPLACLAFALGFAMDARWEHLSLYTAATGVGTAFLLVFGYVTFKLRSRRGSPPRIGNLYGGLIQRLDFLVFFAWQVTMAIELWREIA
jgi:hypothetical membrane protein